MPLTPGTLIADRFEVDRLAGSGGMGAVYRARDRASSGAPVALKLLDGDGPRDAERFAREAELLAELRHPGIVRHVAHGRTVAGEPWLAMEWLEGEDLGRRVARAGLTIAESADLGRRVAEALGAAHARGIVHRDVKPSNLFLDGGDLARVKVLDFGVARAGGGARTHTRTGMLLGTPGYMAPEQARGERRIDARADVFSLGCVLFECLTGRAAFVGEHVLALLAKILIEEAPRPSELRPDVPPALDALVARMLAKDPATRPADGAEVAAALAGLGALAPGAPSPAAESRIALTTGEQRLLCVVLAGDIDDATPLSDVTSAGVPTMRAAPPVAGSPTVAAVPTLDGDGQPAFARTLDRGAAGGQLDDLRGAAAPFGAHVERLLNGSIVVTLAGRGGAADQAAQAARCALALRARLSSSPMALATGRGVIAGRWPVGEAIDRAARLLRAGTGAAASATDGRAPVRLDDVTAGLLDVRFDLGGDRAGLFLRGERDLVDGTRTLLGKATPCVGRDRELGVLAGLLDECIGEPMARAVLVTGPAGVGKSRLRYEFLRKAEALRPPIELWIGRGDPIAAGAPFGMIAPAIRRAAAILDGEPLDVRRRKLRARVARHVAAADLDRVTAFLGELVGAPLPDDAADVELRAARGDALLMGDQMRRAFETLLAAETGAAPLVIVLEDLHWGDLPSVRFLDAALRALHDRPLLVLALARPEVHELFPSLWSERAVEELRLGELTRRGGERLVRSVLGEATPAELVGRLVERSGGNAFYLEELIRAVADGKGEEIPETLVAVVQARLERLEGDARRVLRAASVFGRVFWRGGLRALLGDDGGDTIDAWLRELSERELCTRRGQGRFGAEEELAFRHALVREAAYASLTDDDRRLGHRLAGEWLERAGETDAAVLAEHFERGGERERAAGCYRRAAEQALGGNDFASVLARAERGVSCLEGQARQGGLLQTATGEALGVLRLLQAEAHGWSGAFAEAERAGLAAMAGLGRGSSLWVAAAGEVATAAGMLGHVARLVELGEALRAWCGEARVLGGPQVVGLSQAAFQLFYAGEYELATALLAAVERAEAEVRERDPGILARIHQARSSRAMFAGDAGAYLDEERAAAAAFEKAGDLRNLCQQRGHIGYASFEIGAFEEAERALLDALADAERLGLPNIAATARHNLGYVLGLLGRLDEGLRVEREAMATFHAQGDRRHEGAAGIYVAAMLLQSGDAVEAERAATDAIEALSHTPAARPMAVAVRALARVAAGGPDEALEDAAAAFGALESLGAVEAGEAMIRLAWVEALWAAGRRPEARTAAAAAHQRLAERAARISDPIRRRSFLERVPENARTVAIAQAIGWKS